MCYRLNVCPKLIISMNSFLSAGQPATPEAGTCGAWLLPDGTFTPGHESEKANPPVEGAVWRGYFECARRILELYAEDRHGREVIAYRIAEEGWAYRDRKQQSRPINEDDIRRVTCNWREYAGLLSSGIPAYLRIASKWHICSSRVLYMISISA